jgi:hypothetical protein
MRVKASKVFGLVAAASCLASSPALSQKVGGWDVGPMHGRDGLFTACLMSAKYDSGTTIGVMMNAEGNWGLVFGHPRWRLREGEAITATVNVDGLVVARGAAKILGKDLILMPLQGAGAYAALQAGHAMRVTTSIGAISNRAFNLSGTRVGMDAVIECVRTSGGTSRQPSPAPPPATSRNQQSPVPAAEAMAMLNNMLAKAGVSGHQFETPKGNTITWYLPDGRRGSFFAYRNWNAPIDQAISAVTEVARADCKGGDLGTMEKAVPTSDGSIVRKIAVACRLAGNDRNITWTLVRRADGLLLSFTHADQSPAAGPEDGERSRQLDDRVLQGVLRM